MVLQRYEWMTGLGEKTLRAMLLEFIDAAAAWKLLLDDFCAVRVSDPENSAENSTKEMKSEMSDIAAQFLYMG